MYWWCWCFWLANSACRTSEFECRMSECACRTSWNFEISNFANHLFLPYHVMSKTHRAFWNFRALVIHWSHCHLQINLLNLLLADISILLTWQIYAWGQNNCGQVGSGTTTNQPTPRKVIAVIGMYLDQSETRPWRSSLNLTVVLHF